jgi:hypothetical protein
MQDPDTNSDPDQNKNLGAVEAQNGAVRARALGGLQVVADSYQFDDEKDPDPYPHHSDKSDPDPHQSEKRALDQQQCDADLLHWLKNIIE